MIQNYDDGGHEYGPISQGHQYETITGLMAVPRAVGAPKLVRIHAEYGVRRIKWSASRSQRPPNIPKVEDTQGDRYLGGSVTTELPRYDPIKGGYDFLVSGEYIYLQAVVRETGEARQETNRKPGVDALPTGKYPYFLALQGYQAREAISSVTAGGITDNNWMTKIGGTAKSGGLVDIGTLYPWPLTWFPPAASISQFY